jgi:1-deoxy-D-xylulose-5-phosphate synthase
LGIPDTYIHHGTQEELWADCGFDAASIVKTVKEILAVTGKSNNVLDKVV